MVPQYHPFAALSSLAQQAVDQGAGDISVKVEPRRSYAIARHLGVAGCACLLLLWHYEGIPGAAKLRFPETWPVVGGSGLVDVPLIGDLTVGKVESYAALISPKMTEKEGGAA
jgi:hypothetical protein